MKVDVYTFQAVNTSGALSGVVIVKAKVEGYYTIAQSSNGELYSWGAITDINGTIAVIGDGTSVYHEIPTPLSPSLFGNKTIIDFDVSQYNAMVLTSDGTVYSIGDGTYFLTGTGNDTFQAVYSINAQLSSVLLTGEIVMQVHQGQTTAMVITNAGRALIWGSNQDGLGIGNLSTVVQIPTVIQACGQADFNLASTGTGTSFVGSITNCTSPATTTTSTATLTPTQTPTSSITVTTSATTAVPMLPQSNQTTAIAIYGFGPNNRGQLGDGTTISRFTPTLIPMNQEYKSIVQGNEFTLGITTNGEVYAWGRGDDGQLGDNSTTYHSQLTPRLVDLSTVLPVGSIIKCATGVDTVLCLSNNSIIMGWGKNSNGQLGDGTTMQQANPVLANLTGIGNATVIDVDMGAASSILLTSDGKVYTCGLSYLGVLGKSDGAVDTSTFQAVNTSDTLFGVTVIKAKMGGYHTMVLSTSGDLYAWGAITDRNGTTNVIGDGTTTFYETPKLLPAILFSNKTVIEFDISQYNTMVLTSDGSVYTIGDGTYYLTGAANDSFQPSYSLNTQLPLFLLSGEVVTQVHQGINTSMVITNMGRALTWGSNQDGALGIGNNDSSAIVQLPTPLVACGQISFTLGSSGASFVGSITNCTDITAIVSSTPTPTGTAPTNTGTLAPTSTVSTTTSPTIITPTDTPTASATNTYTPTTAASTGTDTSTPTATPSTTDMSTSTGAPSATDTSTSTATTSVTGTSTQAYTQTIAATTASTAQTSTSTAITTAAPVATLIPQPAKPSAATVYGFGANNRGQLGDGTTISRYAPTLVASTQSFVTITQGNEFTLGITLDGKLYAWGRGDEGQLADNSTVAHSQLVPKLVDLSSIISSALIKCATGIDTVLCLSNNSVVVGWGKNGNGQISDGTASEKSLPVVSNLAYVDTNGGIADIDMGTASSLVLSSTGKVFTCGSSHFGALGQSEGAGTLFTPLNLRNS
jgi:alpha-tubulin suppressor-like RCC1 family protein